MSNKRAEEINQLKRENEALKNCIDKMQGDLKIVSDKEEKTYLNIIGALLKLILGTSPNKKKHSIFTSQAAIISNLLSYHEGKQGIASKTLEDKFSDANKSLKNS